MAGSFELTNWRSTVRRNRPHSPASLIGRWFQRPGFECPDLRQLGEGKCDPARVLEHVVLLGGRDPGDPAARRCSKRVYSVSANAGSAATRTNTRSLDRGLASRFIGGYEHRNPGDGPRLRGTAAPCQAFVRRLE